MSVSSPPRRASSAALMVTVAWSGQSTASWQGHIGCWSVSAVICSVICSPVVGWVFTWSPGWVVFWAVSWAWSAYDLRCGSRDELSVTARALAAAGVGGPVGLLI